MRSAHSSRVTAAVLLLSASLWGGCQRTNTVEDPPQRGAFPAVRTPIAIPPQGLALVTDNGSDEISAIDLAQDLVVAQPFVGVDPIAANGPHELAVDTKGGFVYVLLTFPPPVVPSGPHAAHGLSTVPGIVEKLDLRDLSRAALLTVDVNPGDVQTTPDESKVLVSHFDLNKAITAEAQGLPVDQMRATLMVIDAASMQPIVDVPVCVAPHEIDVSADGTTVYLACYGEDAVGTNSLADAL